MQLTNSLVSICCNNVLSVTGGDIYISVMTIISSVRQMVEMPIHAINEGTSPVLSYNYGARRPEKVKKAGDFFSLLRKVFIVVPLTYFLPYGLQHGHRWRIYGRTGIQCDRWFSVLYYHAGYHIA